MKLPKIQNKPQNFIKIKKIDQDSEIDYDN